jgi:Domain of unknown function (DUF4209)
VSPSVDELRELDWQSLIAASTSRSCDVLHRTLSRWIGEATLSPLAKPFWLAVEQVLALHLHVDPDNDQPFVPAALLDGIERDLLSPFSKMVGEIDSPDLRARVLDLAWLARVCDHSQVATAVTAYISSADEQLEPNQWFPSFIRIQRAVTLAASMGTTQKLFTETVAAVEERIGRVGVGEPLGLTHRLMGLLLRFQVGNAARWAELSHQSAQAARQTYEARGVGNGSECERERSYLDLEIAWRRRLGEEDAVRLLNVEVSDACVRQAEGVIAAQWPSAKSVASHFIGCAIVRLRQIGGEKSKVDALRLRQQVLQRESVAEMPSMNVSIGLAETVKAARAHVAGKPPVAALVAFAFSHTPTLVADLEEEVRRNAADNPISAMLPQSYLGPRGTVLAEHAGVVDQDDGTGFQLETMRVAHTRQSLVATAVLHVAAEQVRLEHGLDTPWFLGLARSSDFVPAHRERSFARGLAAGLRGDYELASVILIPQFEHAVRELFFRRGIVTSTLPASGAQNEHDLNLLLKHPRAGEIFGDALLFDLRVLLTEKAGANLRNAVAHGLLDDGDHFGGKIYFWWMCLRLVLLPVVTAASAAETPSSLQPDTDAEADSDAAEVGE